MDSLGNLDSGEQGSGDLIGMVEVLLSGHRFLSLWSVAGDYWVR